MPLDTIDLGLALDALAPGSARTTTLAGCELTLVRLAPDGRWELTAADAATLLVLEGLGTIAVDDWRSSLAGGIAAAVPARSHLVAVADGGQPLSLVVISVRPAAPDALVAPTP